MAVLSIEQIYQVARDAGFTPHQAVTWTAIAMAESGGRTSALNDRGEHSVGLWQINVAGDVRQNTYGDLTDPAVNARAAYEISHQGTDMRPWTTTHDANQGTAHDYRRYLPQVEQQIGVTGDGRGVAGYGAELPPPLPGSQTRDDDYDPVVPGLAATSLEVQRDDDQDGLTDAFEQLVGSDPHALDTDSDQLTDSYEALTSHTDPLAADTDHDQISDGDEIAAGSDAGRIPGIGGVLGTGPLAVNVHRSGRDTDQDGIQNKIEKLVGLDPKSADSDADELPDAMEVSIGSDPTVADSDHDGLTDSIEVRNQQNPLAATGSQTNTVPAWTYQKALADRQPVVEDDPVEDQLPGPSAGNPGALDTFLQAAIAQAGDSYVYGATPALSAKDPTAFDCSSLTQWAAHKAGVELPRIAEAQYMDLKTKDQLIPVEQALRTPGALLFYFSEEPKGPLPAGQAHVAISLGNGRTIEAKGSAYGVGEFPAKGRFNFAGVVPGLSGAPGQPVDTTVGAGIGADPASDFGMDAVPTLVEERPDVLPGVDGEDADRDRDGLTDAFERLVGSDLRMADTDEDGLSDGREAMITHTDPLSVDTDQDQLPDAYELATGSDPGSIPGIGGVQGTGKLAENVRVKHRDSDQDGLSNRIEKILGSDPKSADTDGDQLPDAMERSIGTDLLRADTDNDGLTDSLEVRQGLDPLARNGLGDNGLGDNGLPAGPGSAVDADLDPSPDLGSALESG